MHGHAQDEGIAYENGLPVITADTFPETPTRVKVEDLYDSHPATPEREKAALSYGVEVEEVAGSPWQLFSNPIQTQVMLSERWYENLEIKPGQISNEDSAEAHIIVDKPAETAAPRPWYASNYYPVRRQVFNVDDVPTAAPLFTDVFNDDARRQREISKMYEAELSTLYQIKNKEIMARKFEFDSKLYNTGDVEAIINLVQAEQDKHTQWMKGHQQAAYAYFYHALPADKQAEYKDLHLLCNRILEHMKQAGQVIEKPARMWNNLREGKYDGDDLKHVVASLTQHHNDYLKFKNQLAEPACPPYLKEKGMLENYMADIFAEEVPLPVVGNDLEGQRIVDFINALNQVQNNIIQQYEKVYARIVELQDECVEKLAAA